MHMRQRQKVPCDALRAGWVANGGARRALAGAVAVHENMDQWMLLNITRRSIACHHR